MKAPSTPAQPNVLRVLEAGVTAFSAAEVHVAVAPVGHVPEDMLEKYYTLITKHRQVELQSIQPFYTEQQKSPFKFFPWKQGSMHFRFLPEEAALKPSPLTALYTHRNVLGVIGICHCPTNDSLSKAYSRFEAIAKQFPGAMTLRCFAFQPSDEQVVAENKDKEKKANLMMFPPTDTDGLDQLESHASFLMLDFAAGLLGELERWMLTASPAMVDLNTFADTSDKFLGPTSMFGDMHKRFPAPADEEMIRKRRYGRLQKAMGDFSLLAGSPADAADHYNTAAELSRICSDSVWCAAALIGMANAKVLEECLNSGAIKGAAKVDNGDASPTAPSKRLATIRAASQVSTPSTGFGGQQFWELLRDSPMERDARAFYKEAKTVLPKRGGVPLQVEADLQLARLLAGLHGTRARREVSEMASNVMEASLQLTLLEDRLTVMMESAQILGLVGSARKRSLVLWQAVEFSRAHDMAVTNTLQIARKALEPPDDPREADDEPELLARPKPLGLGVPQHWSSVRCACIEGVLSTAILASRHADVWDAAALLLREHWRDLPHWRQESLLKTLEAAANQMSEEEFKRKGPGPPPLITFKRAIPPLPHLQPRFISSMVVPSKKSAAQDLENPFIYNPAEAKDRERVREKAAQAPAQWICGETATVEVEIWNPTSQAIKVERVTVDAEHVGDPSVAPRDQNGSPPAWRPYAFAISIPPHSQPAKVLLTGIPLEKGLYTVTGCTVTLNRVSWHQPWSLPPPTLASTFRAHPYSAEAGGTAEARVTVAEPLPLLKGRLKAPATCATAADANPPATPRNGDKSREGEPDDPPEILHVVALKGQVLSWELGLINAGRLTVAEASLTAEQLTSKADAGVLKDRDYELRTATTEPTGTTPGSPRARAKSPVLSLHLNADRLSQHLPLKPQTGVIRVPIMLHAPQVAGYSHEEEAALTFRVVYHGGRGAPSMPEEGEAPPTPDPIGRQLALPAHIRYIPSLQVNSVIFFEHHEQALPGASSRLGRRPAEGPLSARRRCVIELDILNRAPLALQVWVGERVSPALSSAAWEAVVNSPRPWQQGSSKVAAGPSNVACKIVPAHSAAPVAAFADSLRPAGPPDESQCAASTSGRLPGPASRERRLATMLSKCLSIYWRREDLHDKSMPIEIGALPLPVELLEQALTLQAMDVLDTAPLLVSFSARAQVGGTEGGLQNLPEELLLPAGKEGDSQVRQGAVWGYRVAVGHPLQLSMQLANHGAAQVSIEASIACHSADFSPDVQRGIDDPNVLPCGVFTGVPFALESGGSTSHNFAVCFLLPGLYHVYAYDVHLRTRNGALVTSGRSSVAAAESGFSARPGFILVL